MKAINAKTHEVQAILQGRRTQARRIVKIQHLLQCNSRHYDGIAPQHMMDKCFSEVGMSGLLKLCPYGHPGDILYVRETWVKNMNPKSDQYGCFEYKADYSGSHAVHMIRWKPSTQMPKEAARIFLRVKSVWVERLCDISEADAIAEGVELVSTNLPAILDRYRDYTGASERTDAVSSFHSLWHSVYGSESWDANPWVWAIEFERIDLKEEDKQ